MGTKRQATALEQTSDRFKQAPKGQRLSLGLRLADLQRLSGQDIAAIATYRLRTPRIHAIELAQLAGLQPTQQRLTPTRQQQRGREGRTQSNAKPF